MRRLYEIVFIVFLSFATLFIYCGGNIKFPEFSLSMLMAARDPFDSFDNITTIGLIVQDTSSLDATYEAPIFDVLTQAGMVVVKIDTTTMDQATYNSSNLNWSSLDLAIICAFTDSATVDTSVANGIGDVNLMVLEPYYWDQFFPNDSNFTSLSQDSIKESLTNDFINRIIPDNDSVLVYSSNGLIYTSTLGTIDGVLFYNLAGSIADNIITIDSTNGALRSEFGLADPSRLTDDENQGWTIFNRVVARLSGTYLDSLFTIGMSSDAKQVARADQVPLKNHLELNGHEIRFVDTDSLGSTSYNGSGTDYDDFDGFIFWAPNNGTGVQDDSVTIDVSNIITFNTAIADSLGLGTAFATVASDTANVENIWLSLTKKATAYTFNQKIDFSKDSADPSNRTITTLDSAVKIVDVGTNQYGVATHKSSRHLFLGMPIVSAPSTVIIDSMTTAYWDLVNRSLGWIFEGKIMPASAFDLTTLSSDSVDADWEDNSSSEGGYSVFIYEPDSAYFSHLSASILSDSLAPFWPPNSRIRADVATISGTDSVFSSQGPDTVWTLVVDPPRTNQESLSDTEYSFDINGFLFYEQFDDDDFSANPVWTIQTNVPATTPTTGSAEIDTVKKQLRITENSVETVFSTPFVNTTGDSLKDAEWSFDVKLSDSTSFDQIMKFVFMSHKASITDSSGYEVGVQNAVISADGFIVGLLFRTTTGVPVLLDVSTAVVGAQEIFKWHTIKVKRDWDESPQDTTVTFTVFFDGDSVLSAVDERYTTADFMGFKADTNDIRIDNITFKQITPSANHDSTQYAVQDSVSGLYVQFITGEDTLKAGEDWRTYLEWGGTTRNTLKFLQPDSLYQLRSKAKNRWPSVND